MIMIVTGAINATKTRQQLALVGDAHESVRLLQRHLMSRDSGPTAASQLGGRICGQWQADKGRDRLTERSSASRIGCRPIEPAPRESMLQGQAGDMTYSAFSRTY
jgi:hypothetical protein